MKKIKLILILSIILCSCGRNSPQAGFVVLKVVRGTGNMCKYMGHGRTHNPLSLGAMIYDTCGKFNIGDTIKFVK